MALKKKRKLSKRKLKLLEARMRMKRVQKIMSAVRTHQKNTSKTKAGTPNKIPNNVVTQDLAKKIINNKIKAIRGRISSSRKRARDLWTK